MLHSLLLTPAMLAVAIFCCALAGLIGGARTKVILNVAAAILAGVVIVLVLRS